MRSSTRTGVQASASREFRDADRKTSVLFVCLGNICRSPTAEAVLTAVVKEAGLESRFVVDSCGTGGGNPNWYKEGGWSYHEGEDADPRMTEVAARRGVHLTSKSRPLKPDDLNRFDYIIGMDSSNMASIQVAADYWASKGYDIPKNYRGKLKTMTSYCRKHKGETEVPDPYYGGTQGFERVLDLLDDACSGLLQDCMQMESGKK